MSKTENKTLSDIAAEKIIGFIREQNYKPGDRLPTEPELTKMLEVGRNTVREALKTLASKNMVVIRQGAGTFVSEKNGVADDPLGFSMINDQRKLTKDLLQIRAIIEPPIAALAAQNATDYEISCLEKILLELEELINMQEDYVEKDREFHVQLAKCTHNMVMANLIPVISSGVAVFAKTVHEQEFQQTQKSHRKIFQAVKDKRPVEAEQEMQFHILYNSNRYKV